MNRRSAIKGIGLLVGAVVAAPHLIGSHKNYLKSFITEHSGLSRSDLQRKMWREYRIKLEKSLMFGSSDRLLA